MKSLRSSDPLADPRALVRRVYAFVAYRVGDGHLAEDITSETFLRAVRYRGGYDASKGKPVDWMIGIACRCVADALAGSDSVPLPNEVDAEGNLADDAADRVSLHAAIRHLSERDRELIALRYGADLTASQIAKQLEMQTNAVEVALHRAVNRLRESFGGAEPEVARGTAPLSQSPGRV